MSSHEILLSSPELFTSKMTIALVIFLIAYVFISLDKIHHTLVALLGGAVMIFAQILTQDTALKAIDMSVILLLVGMMIIVEILSETGFFEYMAVRASQIVKGNPIALLVLLSMLTAVLSAFLDNVTTILLIVPVTIFIAEQMALNPIPFILSEVFASNIGGTATLIGDPPNILIGSAAKLSFIDFISHLSPVILIILVVLAVNIIFLFGRKMSVSQDLRVKIMEMAPRRVIKDPFTMKMGLIVLGLVIAGFLTHHITNLEPATIALSGAVILMILRKKKPEEVLRKVEWGTLFFFIGLFMLVEGLVHSGVIHYLSEHIMHATGGDLNLTTLVLLWVSGFLSSVIDNIPYVATMIPMITDIIPDIAKMSGMPLETVRYALWWSLSLGACLGGNGTLIGASANVVAVSVAAKNNRNISFWMFTKYGMFIMVQTLIISSIYVYIRYLKH